MRLLARGTAVALGVPLLLVVLHTVLSPLYGAYKYDTSAALLVAAAAATLLVALTLALRPVAVALEARPWLRRPAVLAALVAFFYGQVTIGLAIRLSPGWDASVVAGIAERMALALPDDPSQQVYIGWYPNNAFIVAMLHVWDSLSLSLGRTDLWSSLVVLNSLAMTSAVGLAYLAARRLGGPVTAYVTLGLSALFIGLSPWVAVAYSDTLTMPFPALVLWLFAIERGRPGTAARATLWAAMAAATVVGHALKPTAVFALAAAVVVALVVGARAARGSWRLLVACCTATAVAGAVAAMLVEGLIGARGLDPAPEAVDEQLNVTHFLKMGAQQPAGVHNDYFGGYWEEDVLETRAMRPEDRPEANLERYAERVADMGPVGYARFLERKAAWTLGDGSFFAWGEGFMAVEPTPFLVTDPDSAQIQQWFGLHGKHYATTYSVWQGTWLVVLLLIAGAAAARGSALLGAGPTMVRLSLLMLAVFLLLFEARARYLLLYLPYFLVLAAITLDRLAPAVVRIVRTRASRAT